MKLIAEAGRISRTSHSMWAFYLLVLGSFAPEITWMLAQHETDPYMRLYAMGGATIYGLIGRLLNQSGGRSLLGKLSDWLPRLLILAALLMALMGMSKFPVRPADAPDVESASPQTVFDEVAFTLIAKWEGKRNAAYQDIVGVWTICYGSTRGVRAGMHKTDAECKALLIAEIHEYRDGLHRYLTDQTKASRLPPKRDAAYTSLAYNVGWAGAGRSTAVKRLNAGDIAGGCKALTWWNKAGGRVVLGLVNRRKDEYQYCMAGVA